MHREVYLVTLSPQGLARAPAALRGAATDVAAQGGGGQLAYRDPLTAYKVAAATGGRVTRAPLHPVSAGVGGAAPPRAV